MSITSREFSQDASKARTDQGVLAETSSAPGRSAPGRLHEQFVTIEVMTPGQYGNRGAGLEISYGCHPSPFGPMWLACTERGICALSFAGDDDPQGGLAALSGPWPRARLREDVPGTKASATAVFDTRRAVDHVFHLAVRGTNFQVNVWRALLRIPPGRTVSYQQLADYVGRPTAVRATANAVAANPVAYLIPCHRVLRRSGALGGYRWGTERKRSLLAWDSALDTILPADAG